MAATDLLTDKGIRAALKAAVSCGNPKKLPDGAGLHLEARPTGAGWWRLRYRFAGKEGMLSLGTYPEVGLAEARRRRTEARAQIASGIDPSAARKAVKAEKAKAAEVTRIVEAGLPAPGTFEAVAREWIETTHAPGVTDSHSARTLLRFETFVFPEIGRRPIGDIETPEVLAMLRRITARGTVETAHRVKHACGQVFRFGITSGLCGRDPTADLREALPSVQTKHHAAIVEPKPAGELLRDIAEYRGHPVTRAALALSALLLLRPGELRQMQWSWIDFEGAMLTVPSSIMKRKKKDKVQGQPHLVPLAPQAIAVLRELHSLTGAGDLVFPGGRDADVPMSMNTVRAALRRMGYGNDDMTAHGFRAMARTMAAERLGVAPEVIEAQLAHAVPDALGRAYNRTQYLDQRRDLMSKWADYLDRLRAGAEVIPLRAGT